MVLLSFCNSKTCSAFADQHRIKTLDGQSPKQQKTLKQNIIEACLEMNGTCLNQGKSGNISARTDDGFAITALGVACNLMDETHIGEMDLGGGQNGKLLPSSEWRMHRDIYAARPEALCRQFIAASQMGNPHIFDDAQMKDVLERFKTYGKQTSEFNASM